MILSQVITAIVLGITAGAIPGPIILLAFSEIVNNPYQNLLFTLRYVYVVALTELGMGLFLIISSRLFSIPQFVFYGLSLLGGLLLVYLGLQTSQAYKGYKNKKTKSLSMVNVAALMVFNGPAWMFWLSVNLPNAFRMKQSLFLGEYLYVAIFEIAMVSGMTILLILFKASRSLFANQRVLKALYFALSVVLIIVGIKMFYSGALSFLHYSNIK